MGGILDFFRNAGKDSYREALHAESGGNFAKAAEIYAGTAAEYAHENALICAGYCGDAALAYLKAENLGNARDQEKATIESLHKAGYLKNDDNRLDFCGKRFAGFMTKGLKKLLFLLSR